MVCSKGVPYVRISFWFATASALAAAALPLRALGSRPVARRHAYEQVGPRGTDWYT